MAPTVRSRWLIALISAILGVAIAPGAQAQQGQSANGTPDAAELAAYAIANSPHRPRCHAKVRGQDSYRRMCRFGPRRGQRLVIYADSHGTELSAALRSRAKAENLRVTQITGSACPPAIGFSPTVREQCAAFTDKMIAALSSERPATVVVAINFELWNTDPDSELFWSGVEQTLTTLTSASHRVILLGLVPTHPDGPLPAALAAAVAGGQDASAYRFVLDPAAETVVVPQVEQMAARTGVEYVPLMPALCEPGTPRRCRGMTDGIVHYFDGHHLSVPMAGKLLDEVILPVIRQDPPTAPTR